MNKSKVIIANFLNYTYLSDIIFKIFNIIYKKNYIRVINYHDTPEEYRNNFEQQLIFYKKHFSPVSITDLKSFIDTKTLKKDKPGLIISFDDGLQTNYKVAKPLLEKYGFIGWFFIPSGFIETMPENQNDFAKAHNIAQVSQLNSNKRIAMSWDELFDLNKKHVIGCHTFTHRRMNINDSEEILKKEIIDSKMLIEKKINSIIEIFCWVGGEEHTYTKKAAEYISKSGYRYSFMTNTHPITKSTAPLQLQRTNVEIFWPFDVVKFQICGILDLFYFFKRYRVNKITETTFK